MSQSGLEPKNQYFRSLGQLENTPEFEQFLHREFPQAASEFPEGVSRRRWIQLMGASLALGGLSGCRYNKEEIASFIVRPEGRIAGVPNFFATNFEWAGRAVHLLATNLDGRPVKLDGNPQHPLNSSTEGKDFKDGNAKFASAGCDVFAQAAILSLYDPERLESVYSGKEASTWEAFEKVAADSLAALDATKGKGLAVVYEPTTSPSLLRALNEVKAKFPQATFVKYDSLGYGATQAKAVEAAGGAKSKVVYKLDAAKVIVAVDADLLGADPAAMFHIRQFAKNRTPNKADMNRLYAIESQFSVTGGAADFRLAVKSSQIPAFVAKLEAAIDKAMAGPLNSTGEKNYFELTAQEKVQRTIDEVANDLVANKGASLLAVGPIQSAEVQQAALRINAKLGNVGKTVVLLEPDLTNDVESIDLAAFAASTDTYLVAWVLGGNPVFGATGDVKFAETLRKVGLSVYLSDYLDETSVESTWTLPVAHPLESWGDARAFDGTYGVCQPQIAPLKNGRSSLEVLTMLAGLPEKDAQRFVMTTAERVVGHTLSAREWKEGLHAGYFANTQYKVSSATIGAVGTLPDGPIDTEAVEPGKAEVVFLPSDSVYDGRLANNAWLQELPQPVTKLVWDNAAIVSPKTARELKLVQGEIAQITVGMQSISLPVFVVPGQAEGSVAVQIGYGRTKAGTVGDGVGHPVNMIRMAGKSVIPNADIKGTTVPYKIATTQDHFAIDEIHDQGGLRETAKRTPQLVREGTLEYFESTPQFAPETYKPHHANESLWEEPIAKIMRTEPDVPQWAMTVDLNKCVGCNACVIACQSENNVPVVGKDQVSRGREMHWLRLDRYFSCDFDATYDGGKGTFADPIDPVIVHQPLACVHCETAPCEQVCPVAATVHTEEGINAMAYNRCIGTRYCANNCPYKTRRFNYYNYNTEYGYFYGWQDKREEVNTKLQSLILNPEVTVRGRGVMEKCTYCIQRVQNGKIYARQTGDGKVHDGDIKTACQEACPSQAIVFGNKQDKTSRVSQLQNDPRCYGLLDELNTKPRTQYLARIRNVPKRLMNRAQLSPPPLPHHDHGDEGHAEEGHTEEKHS